MTTPIQIMYFTCSTLKTKMTIAACEGSRTHKHTLSGVQSCVGCTKWQKETTDPTNLQSKEQMHAEALESISRPVPRRVNTHTEMTRIFARHH